MKRGAAGTKRIMQTIGTRNMNVHLQPYGEPPMMPIPSTTDECESRCWVAMLAPALKPLTECFGITISSAAAVNAATKTNRTGMVVLALVLLLFVCLFGEGTHARSVVAEASGILPPCTHTTQRTDKNAIPLLDAADEQVAFSVQLQCVHPTTKSCHTSPHPSQREHRQLCRQVNPPFPKLNSRDHPLDSIYFISCVQPSLAKGQVLNKQTIFLHTRLADKLNVRMAV